MLHNKTTSYKTIKVLCRFQGLPLSNFDQAVKVLCIKDLFIYERALATFFVSFILQCFSFMNVVPETHCWKSNGTC